MVVTPVLYITFARPEYASQSFAAIKAAKPKKLYFYSNKARSDRLEEVERNNEVRGYINQIDWECEVKTWFREEYVDVYTSLWGAIDWLFENEPMGIVLEEDCVASGAFFHYCDQLLPKYIDNSKIWIISGNNYTPEANPKKLDYFFVHSAHIYGWASWADRWHALDRKMTRWNELTWSKRITYSGSTFRAIWLWLKLRRIYKNIDIKSPWDYVFVYNRMLNDGLGIIPCKNLVADIGVDGVHHDSNSGSSTANFDFCHDDGFTIIYEPSKMEHCKSYDKYNFYHHDFYPTIKRKFLKLVNILQFKQ